VSVTVVGSMAVTVHVVVDVGWLCVRAALAPAVNTPPPPTTILPAGHDAVAVLGLVLFVAVAVPTTCWYPVAAAGPAGP
jgi:hypothetical protein